MSGEYRRIQVYFPVKEVGSFRAIEALALKEGVSKSTLIRGVVKRWLATEGVLATVAEAITEVDAREHIQGKDPCRHRTLLVEGGVKCRALGTTGSFRRCVGCEDYEPK